MRFSRSTASTTSAAEPRTWRRAWACPAKPQHPRVAESYARINEKLHAAGKRMLGEVMESISMFDLTKGAIAELLQKHGRQTKLGW